MSLYNGPIILKNKLESFYGKLEPLFKADTLLLKEKANVLETKFGHFLTTIIQDEFDRAPKLSIFTDPEGRGFIGISSSSPAETTSSLYRYPEDSLNIDVKDLYTSIFPDGKSPVISRAIYQSPIRLNFVAYAGNERLLRRELLKETIAGKEFYKMSSKVSDELYNEYIAKYRKWINMQGGQILCFPTRDKLKLVLGMPKLPGTLDSSIIIELSRLFQRKFLDKYSFLKSSSVSPEMHISRPVAMVFEVDFVNSLEILKQLEDLYGFYFEAINRTTKTMMDFVEKNSIFERY